MKLRFRNNSLRLRVNQREVEGLASGALLEEQVYFPGDGRISYILQPSSDTAPQASFREGVIRVLAPQQEVKEWANGGSIGMYFEFPAHGTSLKVSIEKDLECVDGPTEERDPDAFPRGDGKNC
jgi:hypothetical protein